MFNKEEDNPRIDPVKAGVLKKVAAPVQDEAVKKIAAWKSGDEINLTGVDGHVFNELNDGLFHPMTSVTVWRLTRFILETTR